MANVPKQTIIITYFDMNSLPEFSTTSVPQDVVSYMISTDNLLQGDSGGPLNCPDGGTRVAGVTSWGISSGGDCLQNYPSVYTRTSAYLAWIAANTP